MSFRTSCFAIVGLQMRRMSALVLVASLTQQLACGALPGTERKKKSSNTTNPEYFASGVPRGWDGVTDWSLSRWEVANP